MNSKNNSDSNETSSQFSFGSAASGETSSQAPVSAGNDAEAETKVLETGTGGLGNLFEITRELHALESALIESGGEMPDELQDRFTTACIAREKKVDAYHAIIDRCASLEAEYKAKAEFFSRIAKSAQSTAKRLKLSLKEAMSFLGVSELEGQMIRFKLTDGKTRVVIEDEGMIPMEYLKEEIKLVPNMERIETMLKAGEQVPGCKLASNSSLRTYPARKGK